jgi:hypothetical protein
MCTDVTHKDFITVHHELAHIQYFLNYRNNPKVFRDGANPGLFWFVPPLHSRFQLRLNQSRKCYRGKKIAMLENDEWGLRKSASL